MFMVEASVVARAAVGNVVGQIDLASVESVCVTVGHVCVAVQL